MLAMMNSDEYQRIKSTLHAIAKSAKLQGELPANGGLSCCEHALGNRQFPADRICLSRQILPDRQAICFPSTARLGQNGVMLKRLPLFFLLLLIWRAPLAANLEIVLDTAERYVRQQTQGLPGKVGITMGTIETGKLPPCSAHEAFSPPGTRLSGKTHIGVRCLGPNIWSALIPVQITVTGNYVTTSHPLVAGQVIQAADLATLSGDLSALPTGIVTDPVSAIGKTLRNSLGSGQPLRGDQLLAPLVIRQGQSVRVISRGTGFAVSAEGKAMNNAAEGQIVQVRLNAGQTISGQAKTDGSVEIAY